MHLRTPPPAGLPAVPAPAPPGTAEKSDKKRSSAEKEEGSRNGRKKARKEVEGTDKVLSLAAKQWSDRGKRESRLKPHANAPKTSPPSPAQSSRVDLGVGGATWHQHGSVYVKDYGSSASTALAAFDMDSTLILTKSGKTFAESCEDWKFWNECVPSKLQELHAAGKKVVIITNQRGVAKGNTSLQDVQRKIDAIQTAVGNVPMLAVVITDNDMMAKPLPGTFILIESGYNGGETIDKDASFYCGDAAGRVPPVVQKKDFSSSDLKFALNVGLPFMTPEELFLGESQEYDRHFEFDPRGLGLSPQPHPVPPLSDEQTLVIIVGAPGSGKSHLATTHYRDAMRVNNDTLKTKTKCLKVCQEALDAGKSVVIDNQNRTKADRKPYLTMAAKAGVRCVAVYYDVPKELCFHLDRYRKLDVASPLHRPKTVPGFVIHAFFKNFQVPTTKEGYKEVFRVSLEHFRLRGTCSMELMRSFLE